MKKKISLLFYFFVFNLTLGSNFSDIKYKFFTSSDFIKRDGTLSKSCVWQSKSNFPFTELILSWNALRPKAGSFSFFVSVKSCNHWTPWQKLAQWSSNRQETFVNSRKPIMHTKHVRVVLTKDRKANGFRIKVLASGGADLRNLSALFVNTNDMNKFFEQSINFKKETTYIRGFPRQSQMIVNHERYTDICSPTSLSMILNYYLNPKSHIPKIGGLSDYTANFANLVHDDSYLDIYGNWILNVSQVFDSSKGSLFCRVQRLNNFDELYDFVKRKIPIAVSIRGKLRGGRKPYDNGHFVVVIGWSQKRRSVICVDPAFWTSKTTLKAYNLKDFLTAWGKSRNLSYITIPRNYFVRA